MASKHTTSIVDISEIEDDEAPLALSASLDQRPISQLPRPIATGQSNCNCNSNSNSNANSNANANANFAKPQVASQTQLYLYHEDVNPQQRISSLLSNMMVGPAESASAASTLQRAHSQPAIDYPQPAERPAAAAAAAASQSRAATPTCPKAPEERKANLGTLSGVYFPCVQNIFGVILFIRMVWIVGTAGVPAAFALVLICCCVTLTTSISLSAIATNGIVPAGGSYFMISRSLGPECGGAVGTMFFLGTTVAGAMYITGAVEITLNYLAPQWGLFGDFQRDVSIMYHNIRVYGSILLILIGLMVWIGVRFVSKLAPIALFCVLFSIFSIYAGVFINYNGRPDLMICVMGERLVTLKNMPFEDPAALELNFQRNLTNQVSSQNSSHELELRRVRSLCSFEKLRYVYCPSNNQPDPLRNPEDPEDLDSSRPDLFKRPPNMSNCDPYFRANRDRIRLERAVPGIASGVFFDNLRPRFREKRTLVSYDDGSPGANSDKDYNNVFVDITTSFTILISIYFPSCTGILAGSNRSGDLADAQKSIPRGTIAAQLTTSFIYLSCIVLFGATFNNLFIRDKFGESAGGQLAVTQIAWPHPYIILIGGLLSTLGASLQSLVGAPRILQGIAKDEVIPCFNRFAKLSARGEPETAILFTLAISWLAVLIGNLDFIAPILTLSLVMCYFFINLACTLHSLLGSPNWRPRFKHYHWSISTLGCLLCLFVMIVSSLLYFLIAIFLASCIYKYIEFSGAEKEWGDGKQGLALSAARYNLLRLKTSEPHTKNWRPQLLLFCKLKPAAELEPASLRARPDAGPQLGQGELRVAHPKLLTFASQLKAGKGLTLVSSVIEGQFKELAGAALRARNLLQEAMAEERVKGFADVLIANSLMDGLAYHIQSAGLGGLKHNTVIVGWPADWRRPNAARGAGQPQSPASKAHMFIELLRNVQVSQNALLVMKGADCWPESCDKLGGFIDIWWIVNDGGLLMLLPHLLKQHKTWKGCQLRVFTVAQDTDNSPQMREDLSKFLYHLRIQAQVDIVEMNNAQISDYAYERTLMMEQRSEIMKRLNANRKQSVLLEQEVEGRVIRFRIRKPSTCDFEDLPAPMGHVDQLPMVELHGGSGSGANEPQSPCCGTESLREEPNGCGARGPQLMNNLRPDEANVRRMHTALTLNEAILKRSKSAKLVILNLPGAPKVNTSEAENNYMEFVEIITDKLERVLLVQNGGREVITIHS